MAEEILLTRDLSNNYLQTAKDWINQSGTITKGIIWLAAFIIYSALVYIPSGGDARILYGFLNRGDRNPPPLKSEINEVARAITCLSVGSFFAFALIGRLVCAYISTVSVFAALLVFIVSNHL